MDRNEKEAVCGLYRLVPDLSCHRIESNIKVTNGPCKEPRRKDVLLHGLLDPGYHGF
jgi:hypothetical protein